MHALHQTLLPSSAIFHSLYLPHFTPSTIYPLPKPHTTVETPEVKVVGNLIVAGGEDLRVFEIRDELVPTTEKGIVANEDGQESQAELMAEGFGDGFFESEPAQSSPMSYETSRRLHLLSQHQIHGTITGLAAIRTIDSSVDGLDRLLVSFKDAKMALLEWSRGDISTVSLHTYERCPQMVSGDLQTYVPRLRSDPLSRVAVLTLPEDSLAILPVLQEQSELDVLQDTFVKDVPYSPSYVLALADVSSHIRNIQDLLFLPGFHSPTIALLFSPNHTWAGRYHSAKDTFHLEIRTLDLSAGGSYPLLTSVSGLPSDSLYILACPPALGGIVLITTTGIIHIDQGGRVVAAGVNAWWDYTTSLSANRSSECRRLTLEGSRCVFVGDRDMLLVLQNGDVHQVRFEMDGRAVGTIKVDEQSSSVPPPSSIVVAGDQAVFVGCVEGDSLLAKVNTVRDVVDVVETKANGNAHDMEVDWDEDLYGDLPGPTTNGTTNGVSHPVATGPATITLSPYDVLTGVGKIVDMCFGTAATDQGTRTYPQLVAISGGSKQSTFNVFRRGVPITKKRRFDDLSKTSGVWFLPIQRPLKQKFKEIPDAERTSILISTEKGMTKVFALSSKNIQDLLNQFPEPTVAAAPFFQRSSIVHVTPSVVTLLDADGKLQIAVCPDSGKARITSASISDPYIVIQREDGSASFFVGDSVGKEISETTFTPGTESPLCQAIEVFTDTSGIYRSFEAVASDQHIQQNGNSTATLARASAIRTGQKARMQLTDQQIKRLQEEKPAISLDAPSMELALNSGRGSQWLAVLSKTGDLQIRSLPDLAVVLQSDGLSSSDPSFTDDLVDGVVKPDVDDELDEVKQMIFLPIGTKNPRPHLIVLHHSGRLNAYEAQPRYTLDASTQTRRSLAVRFRKVHTQLLPISSTSKLPYTIIPFSNIEGLTGAFITGDKPFWIISDDSHSVRAFGLKQAAMAFGKTTHLGKKGDYFILIEDGSFICYLPPTLNTDFEMPCDRYEMKRTYSCMAFDPPSAHYVGATAIPVAFQLYDEEGEIILGPEGDNLIPPLNERSSVELFSQGSDPWRVVDGYDFEQNEVVLCMESVVLESPSTPTGRKDFIAVGTGLNFGEDRASRGNVYIFEIVEKVSEVGKPKIWGLKMRCKDPTRNPVSALSHINGYLLHSNGPKVFVKGLDFDERLMGLAFLDVMLYVTSIKVFKNFILISDLVKSIWFVAFQETPYKFTTLGKDLQQVSLVAGDFLVHEGQVTFLTNDRFGEMRMVDFDPTDPDSLNGEKLILRTEFHTGAAVTCAKSIARRKTAEEEWAPQTQIIYSTLDGSITTVVSVKPARFKRLQLVSDQLVRNARHVAGLNPRAFRTVRNDLVPRPLSKGILDGGLLQHFALQPIKRQREMMRQIGTDAVTVASDLQALGGFW